MEDRSHYPQDDIDGGREVMREWVSGDGLKKTVDTIERFAVEYQKLTKGRSWIIKTF
jgi:hypothetical protein